MRWILGLFVLTGLAFMAYVRLAPHDAGKYHFLQPIKAVGDYTSTGGFTVVRAISTSAEEILTAVETLAMQTPRTTVLAGSAQDGLITFITRSRLMGYPDYTTVYVDDRGDQPVLVIHGRLRFGLSDAGVNKARIENWLSQLGAMLSAS